MKKKLKYFISLLFIFKKSSLEIRNEGENDLLVVLLTDLVSHWKNQEKHIITGHLIISKI